MLPIHFSDVLLSNWQSAVAKLARKPDVGSGQVSRPPLQFGDPRGPLVPATAQRLRQLLFQQLLDETAHSIPAARLNRVKPGLSGEQRRAVCFRYRVILFHGVVSTDASTPV